MKPGNELLFLALGGSGEIGMNVNLYGCQGKWIMVDLGMTFADPAYPGVELILPDLTFIEENRDVVTSPDPTVIVAVGANIQIANELLANVGMPTRLTLLPRIGRNLQLFRARSPGFFLLFPPCHPGNVRDMVEVRKAGRSAATQPENRPGRGPRWISEEARRSPASWPA